MKSFPKGFGRLSFRLTGRRKRKRPHERFTGSTLNKTAKGCFDADSRFGGSKRRSATSGTPISSGRALAARETLPVQRSPPPLISPGSRPRNKEKMHFCPKPPKCAASGPNFPSEIPRQVFDLRDRSPPPSPAHRLDRRRGYHQHLPEKEKRD